MAHLCSLTEPSVYCGRLAAVHLVDAHLASDPAKYMAALLASLAAMLHLGLPHVNVLSKVRSLPPRVTGAASDMVQVGQLSELQPCSVCTRWGARLPLPSVVPSVNISF